METNKAIRQTVHERIRRLKTEIGNTAKQAGRDPGEIQWILVTKTVPPEVVEEARRAGVQDFGENRVQELLSKKGKLAGTIRWHMIGHVQTNKVKQLVGEVALIHSLDRPDLAQEIERQARRRGIEKVDCLIQVNTSGEKTKYGFPPPAAETFVKSLAEDSPVRIRGIMTIGPLTEDETEVRRVFRKTREFRDRMKERFPSRDWSLLSMGMSADYRVAIQEGANLLRIGTAVFGPRPAVP